MDEFSGSRSSSGRIGTKSMNHDAVDLPAGFRRVEIVAAAIGVEAQRQAMLGEYSMERLEQPAPAKAGVEAVPSSSTRIAE